MDKPFSFNRLVAVSHRGPLVITSGEDDSDFSFNRSVSGLVSVVNPVIESTGGVWIAWCGRKKEDPGIEGTRHLPTETPGCYLKEITVSSREHRHFYLGFANRCMWPICHSFIERSVINHQHWEQYRLVNSRYARAAAEEFGEGDLVWVHDFQLALVPQMIRDILREQKQGVQSRQGVKISFFWHVPFPPLEVFSVLPWAREILEGVLGADSIAFHSPRYVENFLRCVEYLLGEEAVQVDRAREAVFREGRKIPVRARPVEIESAYFEELASRPEVRQRAASIREDTAGRFLALGADRLDYTKGIVERLRGVELFLEENPEYRERFTFLQIAVPSRTENRDYRELRRLVEETVGRINGRFGTLRHVPVLYRFVSLDLNELVAHYLAADLALVTPLRDGLNLVAKELVASRVDNCGVLMLSPFAGVSEQLQGAVMVNPYSTRDVAEKIRYSLEMPVEEKDERMRRLRETVRRDDLGRWWRRLLEDMQETCE